MLKLIFKTAVIMLIIIITIVAMIVWKKGEGFRWIGRKTAAVGQSIEKFGSVVDEIGKEQKKAAEKIIDLRKVLEQTGNKDKNTP